MTAARGNLAEQLDLKPGMRCWFHNMPEQLAAQIDAEAHGVDVQPTASAGLHCAHLFVDDAARLEQELAAVVPLMQAGGFLWVGWAGRDVSDEAIRTLADGHSLTESKRLALDDRWSAVKLTRAKEAR
jgi:hypothetical protein